MRSPLIHFGFASVGSFVARAIAERTAPHQPVSIDAEGEGDLLHLHVEMPASLSILDRLNLVRRDSDDVTELLLGQAQVCTHQTKPVGE